MKNLFLKYLDHWTDVYFKKTRSIVQQHGDQNVCYGVFLRSPCIVQYDLVLDFFQKWAQEEKKEYGSEFHGVTIYLPHKNGDIVQALEPLFYYEGSFQHLSILEPFILQRSGFEGIIAFEVFQMVKAYPSVAFIAMDFRHCIDHFMAGRVAKAVAIGSSVAKIHYPNTIGFIGNATDATSKEFGLNKGMGTMSHAFIGYAGSTLKAASLYHKMFPSQPLVVLVDYFGLEITDSLNVCKTYADLAHSGLISLRFDTPASRYMEGLDKKKGYELLKPYVSSSLLDDPKYTDILFGPGTSVASAYYVHHKLKKAGFDKIRIIFSSSFALEKVKIFALTHAPIHVIGTGSYLSIPLDTTYATADIISYNHDFRIKLGREFLIHYFQSHQTEMKKIIY